MKSIVVLLIALFFSLQYKLWFEAGGMKQAWSLQHAIVAQLHENSLLSERNTVLSAEVADLKQGQEAIAEHARTDLGMVKQDETFYEVM